jgi:hypothetical protein
MDGASPYYGQLGEFESESDCLQKITLKMPDGELITIYRCWLMKKEEAMRVYLAWQYGMTEGHLPSS